MKVKELIERLTGCEPEAHIIFYNLEGYNLDSWELESIIGFPPACEGEVPTVEITIKPEGSDEGGNYDDDSSEDGGHWKPSPFN